ncbi:hypothetical protein M2399_003823 [Pseudomonas sp. BIGb0450]|jgi:hypothetical protein|uniref:SUKH-4 family immunity protein n=1 Tax=unclassified Pseudomonas TaxID=196821 RepID=UPI0021691692|nr:MULTISPECIES: SUKH-4 family immunity protein [unclassified Pseudomonas]MCS3418648.1 hypothetical protein [Pseudomonas sp. BIGb0558]MCS3438368.1 hypothetical protein [Pseudomonas sp. BIGb0450]
MTGFDFKARFLAALPIFPPEPDLSFDEFVVYEAGEFCSLAAQDAQFLVKQGLPRDAAPFLSFEAYSAGEIAHRLTVYGISEDHFLLGHNGSGDALAIDRRTREVVSFNHDFNNERVFINSTLMLFAQCLCIFQEHLRDSTIERCLAEIERVDPAAAAPSAMWAGAVSEELC